MLSLYEKTQLNDYLGVSSVFYSVSTHSLIGSADYYTHSQKFIDFTDCFAFYSHEVNHLDLNEVSISLYQDFYDLNNQLVLSLCLCRC